MASAITSLTPTRTIATHCPYCALQCGMLVAGPPHSPEMLGNARFPVNNGGLCAKGWSAGATLAHPDRLTTPLVRSADGRLVPATWDAALDRIADACKAVQRKAGHDAVGVFGGGSLTNETDHLLGKFALIETKELAITTAQHLERRLPGHKPFTAKKLPAAAKTAAAAGAGAAPAAAAQGLALYATARGALA
ncbi:MAG: molybdopterin-dependent oxidoreductase [Acidobacteriota bacterium]